MADIFISYAREDRPQAERLALALQREGFTVWWDLESLRSGQSFNRAIQQALEQAKCVVVLWTSISVCSKWVESEAYWAWEHDKLHSVRLDDAVSVPVPFNTSHARSLAQWGGSTTFPEFQRLKIDIEAVSKPRTTSRARGREPLSNFRDALRDGGQGPEMVVIPAGTFSMGSPADDAGAIPVERPSHQVEIRRPFALGKTPVTFADYDRFAEATGRLEADDEGWGRGDHPVINVNWNDAVAYVAWLCEQTGRPYRLPTEAEWEYACRAGTRTRWSFGDEEADLERYAWYGGSKTNPVGEKEPNPWGLLDVYGNVWEWVQDCWHDNYRGAPGDGSAWQEEGDCGLRVVRGGAWGDRPGFLRSAGRFSFYPDFRNYTLGCRLAQDL